jgi:alanyl-tRNA synthetase
VTERLYYSNSYLTGFDARVVATRLDNGQAAVNLDRTAFYPTSGGQPNDVGTLNGLAVVDVTAEDGAIWHHLAGSGGIPVGSSVQGDVRWSRRYDHMQQHSGQHLLSQVFERLFSYETVSVHIGEDENTLDLETPSLLQAQIEQAETLANEMVYRALPITAYFVEESQLSMLQLRRPPKVTGSIRIVEIEGYDYSACGGTHCRSTAELGPIKIVRSERRRSTIRITFLCGSRALGDYARKHSLLAECAALFSTDMAQVPTLIERALAQNKEQKRRIDDLTERLLLHESRVMLNEAELSRGVRIVRALREDLDAQALRVLASSLCQEPRVVALLAGGSSGKLLLAFGRSADLGDLGPHMGDLLRETLAQAGGNGGGKAAFAQGGGVDLAEGQRLLDFALVHVDGALGRT